MAAARLIWWLDYRNELSQSNRPGREHFLP